MGKRYRSILFLAALVVVMAAVAFLVFDQRRQATDAARETNFANLAPIATAVRGSTAVVLYEGLPHGEFQPELLQHELNSKPVVWLHGYPFYKQTLPLTPEDADALTQLFCNPKSFRPYRGPKECGGFHPDYCIEWSGSDGLYLAQFCLGCEEVRATGNGRQVYCEMSKKPFAAILTRYRQSRPSGKE